MLLKDFVKQSREALEKEFQPQQANALVGILCSEYLGVQPYTHIVNPSYEISPKHFPRLESAFKRLLDGEPIQYIIGYSEFFGRKFNVNPSVLIPRPETETLCRIAIDAAMMMFRGRSAYGEQASPVRILDLCTGSGCIAWTMALGVPDSKLVAVDISEDALKLASSQPFELEKTRRPLFVQADIFDDDALESAVSSCPKFDIILSNPPYVLESQKKDMKRNVLDYEPAVALFVEDGDAMKFNRKIAEICSKLLDTDGVGIVEINDVLDERSKYLFNEFSFRDVETVKDIFGRNRFVKFRK